MHIDDAADVKTQIFIKQEFICYDGENKFRAEVIDSFGNVWKVFELFNIFS